jgi:hypothetical protein
MIRTLRSAMVLAAALAASAAYADSTGWGQSEHGWNDYRWRNAPQYRAGYENLNDCQPGLHAVPFPNGNGFRCVPDDW